MSYLMSGEDQLSNKFSMPQGEQSKCCVVFVHAAEGNKLGPHRMFVEIERVLINNGFASFRFDLAGCGDSTGGTEFDQRRDLSNLDDVVKFIAEEKKVDKIVLLGMSRGAHTVFRYIQTHVNHVKGAAFLSLPVSSSRTVKKAFVFRIKEYVLKMASKRTYLKLLRNQINYKLVFRTIFQGFSHKRKYSPGRKNSLPGCPFLLIYGEKDPVSLESKDFYLPLFGSATDDVVCETIQGANHSFFHYKWKEEIQKTIVDWLNERFLSNV